MTVKLLTEHHFEFLHLKGGRTGSSESTIVKIPVVGNHMSRLKILSKHCSKFRSSRVTVWISKEIVGVGVCERVAACVLKFLSGGNESR